MLAVGPVYYFETPDYIKAHFVITEIFSQPEETFDPELPSIAHKRIATIRVVDGGSKNPNKNWWGVGMIHHLTTKDCIQGKVTRLIKTNVNRNKTTMKQRR